VFSVNVILPGKEAFCIKKQQVILRNQLLIIYKWPSSCIIWVNRLVIYYERKYG